MVGISVFRSFRTGRHRRFSRHQSDVADFVARTACGAVVRAPFFVEAVLLIGGLRRVNSPGFRSS